MQNTIKLGSPSYTNDGIYCGQSFSFSTYQIDFPNCNGCFFELSKEKDYVPCHNCKRYKSYSFDYYYPKERKENDTF